MIAQLPVLLIGAEKVAIEIYYMQKALPSQFPDNLAMMQNPIRKKLSSRRLRRPNNER
jgi:hypothetical protein